MNNKGFAVTTLIYGLSIMGIMIVMVILGTISVSRRNVRDISNQIEQDLLNYGKANVVYRGNSDDEVKDSYKYSIPEGEAGFYRIEAWGPAGEDGGGGRGRGAYTTGIIFLEDNDELELIPGYGERDSVIRSGGEDIMIAASGKEAVVGGTLCSYKSKTFEPSNGIINDNFNFEENNCDDDECVYNRINGTKYMNIEFTSDSCTFNGVNDNTTDNGKKSFINGYIKINESVKEYSFADAMMLPGVNNDINGMISVRKMAAASKLSDIENHMNDKYKNIKKVRVDPNIDDLKKLNPCFLSVSYFNSDYSHDIKFSTIEKNNQFDVEFDNDVFISDVSFICNNISIDKTVRISLEKDDSSSDIYNGNYIFPSPTGIKLSAFQPDSDSDFPAHGNYYILPINSENNVVNGPKEENINDSVNFDYLTGSSNQKWNIDKINDSSNYKIVNLATFRALDVKTGEKYLERDLSTQATYNMLSEIKSQQWSIKGNGDNTFSLKTKLDNGDSTIGGFILADTRIGGSNNLIIGPEKDNPNIVERFRFYSLDFIK